VKLSSGKLWMLGLAAVPI